MIFPLNEIGGGGGSGWVKRVIYIVMRTKSWLHDLTRYQFTREPNFVLVAIIEHQWYQKGKFERVFLKTVEQ